MKFLGKLYFLLSVLSVLLLAQADDYVGCFSTIGSDKSRGTNMYQTPSKCVEECSDYPYVALKNGNECYCLFDKPTYETDASKCSTSCYGYGDAVCGGEDVFGVYKGDGDASSSSASSDSSSTSSSSSSSSLSKSSSSSSASITSGPSSSDSHDSKTTEVVTTSLSSENGKMVYKTVTISAPSSTSSSDSSASSDSSDSSNKSSGSSSKVGPIVGGVVGGIGGAIVLAALAFFIIRHKNKDDDEDEEEFYDKANDGLGLGRGGTAKTRKVASPLDMPMSNPFVHPSENDDDISAPGATGPSLNSNMSDPRLNPTLMGRRRLSEGSLADEADYSRKILQVANPDH